MRSNIYTYFFILFLVTVLLSCKKVNPVPPSRIALTMEDLPIQDSMRGRFIGMINKDSAFLHFETDEDSIDIKPEIFVGHNMIYQDSSDNFYDLRICNVKIVNVDKYRVHYFLLTQSDPIVSDEWKVITFQNGKVNSVQTIIKGLFEDVDHDSFIEAGGKKIVEAVCDNCDSMYYEPILIYEFGSKLMFEEKLSKKVTMDLYNGIYLGTESSDSILQYNQKFDFERYNFKN
jgi:hypothetical protein